MDEFFVQEVVHSETALRTTDKVVSIGSEPVFSFFNFAINVKYTRLIWSLLCELGSKVSNSFFDFLTLLAQVPYGLWLANWTDGFFPRPEGEKNELSPIFS
jgi:hypothetical protein